MRILPWLMVTLLGVAACTSSAGSDRPAGPQPQRLKAQVVEVLKHNPEAFTQGLEMAGPTLYEGTGRNGRSAVSAGAPGQPPTNETRLPTRLFGEGITLVGPTLWQLTWKDGIAIKREKDTLAERGRAGYSGEGWGLCHQPGHGRLVLSDGSSRLSFRDPARFTELGEVEVTDRGVPVGQLNELECVGDDVYANVWKTDTVVRIDANTGAVTATIDASNLLTRREQQEADVLNGIAAIPGTDQFLLTGKLWPKMFRVRLIPAS